MMTDPDLDPLILKGKDPTTVKTLKFVLYSTNNYIKLNKTLLSVLRNITNFAEVLLSKIFRNFS